ncbi:hypothetical protein [Phaffia rhodozyma]|uniref:Uncharacterized protein n=1 Tax=Phaffia rhodozyma TaxID=264483 RepID=A0A0F7SMU7_PHARH|nr:hypothetical protein [Phaffia rhodozyma]
MQNQARSQPHPQSVPSPALSLSLTNHPFGSGSASTPGAGLGGTGMSMGMGGGGVMGIGVLPPPLEITRQIELITMNHLPALEAHVNAFFDELESAVDVNDRVNADGQNGSKQQDSLRALSTQLTDLLRLLSTTGLGALPFAPPPPAATSTQDPLSSSMSTVDQKAPVLPPSLNEFSDQVQRSLQDLFMRRQGVRDACVVAEGVLAQKRV